MDCIVLPDKLKPIEKQAPIVVLAMLIWGEARGEGHHGRVCVANVVRNRVEANKGFFGKGWVDVCTKKWQFSCFNSNDPNRSKLYDPLRFGSRALWLDCLGAANMVISNLDGGDDPTKGATFYYSPSGMPIGSDGKRKLPRWINDVYETYRHKRHIFYALKA